MSVFKTNDGSEWAVCLNIRAVKNIRTLTGFDILDTDKLDGLAGDPCLFTDVLYAVCRKQAEERNITAEQFAELFDMDAVNAAMFAFFEALAYFFPASLRQVILENLNTAREQSQQQMRELCGKSFMNQPELPV